MKYVKKPIPVEAIRIPIKDKFVEWFIGAPDWFKQAMFSLEVRFDNINNAGLIIKTLEGEMLCEWGNYIIRGIKGEVYPCRHDIFEEMYEVYEE